MLTAYAVRCRFPDVGLIRNALKDMATVRTCDAGDLNSVSPRPDIIFFGWGGAQEEWRDSDEDRKIRSLATTIILLRKIRKSIGFRDVPVVLLVESRDEEDAILTTQFGATGLLTVPLDEAGVRRAISDAMRPVGKEVNIDVNVVNPLVRATVMTLEKVARVKAERKDVFLKKDYALFGDVSAVIGLTAERFEGSVGLTFDSLLAREIIGNMWRKTPGDLSREEVNDGLGELVNIICGQATTELAGAEATAVAQALPTIVNGLGHQISQRSDVPCLTIVFEAGGKSFAVQVAIRNRRSPAAESS